MTVPLLRNTFNVLQLIYITFCFTFFFDAKIFFLLPFSTNPAKNFLSTTIYALSFGWRIVTNYYRKFEIKRKKKKNYEQMSNFGGYNVHFLHKAVV